MHIIEASHRSIVPSTAILGLIPGAIGDAEGLKGRLLARHILFSCRLSQRWGRGKEVSVLLPRLMHCIKMMLSQSIDDCGSSIALLSMKGYEGSPNRTLSRTRFRITNEDEGKRGATMTDEAIQKHPPRDIFLARTLLRSSSCSIVIVLVPVPVGRTATSITEGGRHITVDLGTHQM